MYVFSKKAVDRLPELGVVPPHIIMVEYVGYWAEHIVATSPQTSREADLLPHKYPREKGIKGHVLEPT